MTLEQLFGDLGWDMVGPATSLADAIPLAQTESLDAALLDVNLDGEMSWDIASHLLKRGVPFAFATGYDAKTVLPPALKNVPVVSKPYSLQDIETRLRSLLLVQ